MTGRAAVLALVAVLLAPGAAAAADHDDKPPNRTGCCFSFDDSPVDIVICAVPDACRIEGK